MLFFSGLSSVDLLEISSSLIALGWLSLRLPSWAPYLLHTFSQAGWVAKNN
jgi:hypothetical protein